MTKDEALKLALEALETCNWVDDGGYGHAEYDHVSTSKAITAIKEALANEALEKMAENARELGLDYGPEQDWIERERAVGYREGHMAALAQRTWVGLTDGEVDKMILLMGFPPDWITENAIVKNIVRNLEAKLKEKNSNL